MHFCPDEAAALLTVVTAGPLFVYRFCRHQIGCFCRWCVRLVRRWPQPAAGRRCWCLGHPPPEI